MFETTRTALPCNTFDCRRPIVRPLFASLGLLALLVVRVAPAAQALEYEYRLFSLPSGAPALPEAINDHGHIAGSYRNSGDIFLLTDRETRITIPGASDARVEGMNNRDEIVGTYHTDDPRPHSFIYSNGDVQTYHLPVADERNTLPTGINDDGELVGSYINDTRNIGFHVDADGNVVLLPNLFPHGINKHGVIGGVYAPNNSPHARGFVLEKDGTITTTPPENVVPRIGQNPVLVFVRDINKREDVVGDYIPFPGQNRGYLYDGTNFVTFDLPGDEDIATSVTGVNQHRVVVGTARFSNSTVQGFVAAPRRGKGDPSN